MRYLSKFLLIAVAVGLPMATAHATIRYIDPNGTDSGTCGSGAKCQTFSYAKSVASAGDDFEYSAGTYTLSGQAITGFSGVSTSDYSEVYCATELGCYINGGSTFQPLAVSGATYGWMHIRGFKLKASGNNSGVAEISGPDQSAEANHTHDILVSTTVMICNMETENTAGLQVAFVKNSTFTNIAVEGGRYSVLIYSSRWITVERALVTWKSWGIGAGTQNPVAAFTVYNVYDSTMSNVLVFDPRKPDPTANTNDENAMYLVSNSGATGSTYDHSQNVSFYGCVIINNKMNIAMTVEDNATNAKIRHLVIGGSAGYGLSSRLGSTGSFEFVTISSTGWSGTGDGIFDDSSLTFKHFQVAHGQNNANGGASMTYSNTYGYDDNTNAGTGNTTIDPNIRYILVATNTATAGTGQSGANMGATVLYIFRNGVETNIPMWPWPNEDIFKTFMADASGFNYTDGVFGGTKTITNYVWEYIYGNRAPENFASGGSPAVDTSSPTAPGTPMVTSTGTTTLDISWSASTDDVGVSSYEIDVSTDNFSTFSSGYSDFDMGSGTTEQLTGLTASTTYVFRIRAKDATGNTSTVSTAGTGTTNAQAPASSNTLKIQGAFKLQGERTIR